MARYKPTGKKRRLGKKLTQSRWAPFWVVPKILGTGKKVHPSRFTAGKRSWRRTKTKA